MAGGPTVFVVDDDLSLRRSITRLLKAAGFNPEAYGSAQEFLARPPFGGVGCVLLDVQMPGLSGPELQSELLSRGVALPVVFLTAHGDLPTGIQAMKSGAVDFLQKPVDDEVLISAVHEAAQRHAALQSRELELEDINLRLNLLSTRERQVLKLVVDGRLNKQIADDLGISIKTVKVHRANMMKNMGVRSLAELVHVCERAASMTGACLFGAPTAPACRQRICLNSGGHCEQARFTGH